MSDWVAGWFDVRGGGWSEAAIHIPLITLAVLSGAAAVVPFPPLVRLRDWLNDSIMNWEGWPDERLGEDSPGVSPAPES